jgi:hypothetical protein
MGEFVNLVSISIEFIRQTGKEIIWKGNYFISAEFLEFLEDNTNF